jgi:hypothetical protein
MDANQLQELTPSEKLILAREIAADAMRLSGAMPDLETECEDCGATVFMEPPNTDYKRRFSLDGKQRRLTTRPNANDHPAPHPTRR